MTNAQPRAPDFKLLTMTFGVAFGFLVGLLGWMSVTIKKDLRDIKEQVGQLAGEVAQIKSLAEVKGNALKGVAAQNHQPNENL